MVDQERVKELQAKLHDRRKQMAELRKEMDEIEEELLPMLTKESALNKLKRAGLTVDELKALQ